MTNPTVHDLHHVLNQTWPAAAVRERSGWTIREGKGAGNRVSSATALTSKFGRIEIAEQAMLDLNQPQQFMIRDGEDDLDADLAIRGYEILDPTLLYAAPIQSLTATAVPHMSAFEFWPPLAILAEIWAEGGVGTTRLAVMERAPEPKISILGRTENRASAAAFVAIERNIAMLHALEVTKSLRRKGVARNILRAAAHWAQEHGAHHLSVAVTAANLPANALYLNLGMSVVGKYHYRVKK